MYLSTGVGILALLLGFLLNRAIPFLKRHCVPVPVTGGLVISLLTLLLYSVWDIECVFDETVKDFCMTAFFTFAGFLCNVKVVRSGGRPLFIMLLLVAILILAQNALSIGLSLAMGRDTLFGMATGSIPMCGGHGTSAGFSPLLEQQGLTGAASLTMAGATFGLIAGSLLGGPLADALIRHRKPADLDAESEDVSLESKTNDSPRTGKKGLIVTLILLVAALPLGYLLNTLFARIGFTVPSYFGALVAAVLMRNSVGSIPVISKQIDDQSVRRIATVFLALFLGMAMTFLRLWELKSMALPLAVILLSQVVLMALYAIFVAYPMLGKDYESVVLVSGLCGFGLGATPNALANMEAVCAKYRTVVRPFLIVPIIGAMFLDIINISVITLLLNIF